MRDKEPSAPRKGMFISFLVVVSIAVFAFRFHAFGDMEPRSDQAFFSWWVQGLYEADHFFPDVENGESWLSALERDEDGFLHRLLRVVYSRAISVFTFSTVAARYAMTWVVGSTYGAQVAMCVLASAATVLMLGLFPVLARGRQPDQNTQSRDIGFGIAALLLGATAAYPHIFSSWGVHNFSVLFLVIASAFGIRVLAAPMHQSRSLWIVAAIAYVLAYFSHSTNLFLLPAATILSIILLPDLTLRKRLSITVWFISFSAVLAIPFLIATIAEESRNLTSGSITVRSFIDSNFISATGELWPKVAGKAVGWLEKGSQLFSTPGLALGILGLAIWARTERVALPLFVVIMHFLVWCSLPIFGEVYLRTYLYVMPFLVLGIAYSSVIAGQAIWAALRSKRYGVGTVSASIAVIGVMMAHVYAQVPILASTQEIRHRIPESWDWYFSGQGTLKPVMAEIGTILPERAVVVTWAYGMQFLLRIYQIEGSGRTVAPTLARLVPRFEDGTLPDHIRHRHLSVPADDPMFALIDHGAENVDHETVRRGIENVFGPEGFDILTKATLAPIDRWPLESSWPIDISLYRIETD